MSKKKKWKKKNPDFRIPSFLKNYQMLKSTGSILLLMAYIQMCYSYNPHGRAMVEEGERIDGVANKEFYTKLCNKFTYLNDIMEEYIKIPEAAILEIMVANSDYKNDTSVNSNQIYEALSDLWTKKDIVKNIEELVLKGYIKPSETGYKIIKSPSNSKTWDLLNYFYSEDEIR
ncbi:hypothetical protein [Natranaerobius trueperi]|uniref:Uncharacterized protein n=1 Tax=Natranaerobius trueperi TaxID=759412 RepID=A0A226C1H4_9FIRM|nr:hypothetical protein [Natranaerobius trueperi]OWZ84289.1 hypothetical protein CDO51_04315 [Natranaerobius trueperi]